MLEKMNPGISIVNTNKWN